MTTRTSAYSLVDKDGMLAIKGPLGESWDKPVRQTVYYVSKIPVGDCRRWLGAQSIRISDNDVFWFEKGRYEIPVNTEGWQRVIEEEAIKPPGRGSKNFKWVWSSGKWRKRYL